MNDSDIKKRILEIKDSAIKSFDNFALQRDRSKSLLDPEGEIHYFKEKRFELVHQIEKETLFGQPWVNNGANLENIDIDWTVKAIKVYLGYYPQEVVWESLQDFFKQFLRFIEYEFIIRKSSKRKTKTLSEQEKAIIAYYEGKQVKRSESKFYQHYTFYSHRENRQKLNPRTVTLKQVLNHIKRVEKIILHLSNSAEKTAHNDLTLFTSSAMMEFGKEHFENT